MTDLLDQVVAEGLRGRELARTFRFRDVVRGAERQRLEADLGVTAGQRGRHDDDEVAFLRQQLRQCRDAVEIRHFDVEHGDVGIDTLELIDRVAAGAQGSRDDHVRLGADPTGDQSPDDHGIIHHHDPQRLLQRRLRGQGVYQRNTHYSPDTAEAARQTNADGRSRRIDGRRSDKADFLELRGNDVLVERLHDVFVGPGMKRARDVGDIVFGGTEHQLGRIATRHAAEIAQEFVSLHDRHVPIEQDGVWRAALTYLHGLL